MNYDKKDQEEILRLFKVGNATKDDMDSIYNLLKKYVRPGAAPYILNCNCLQSISAYYQALLEWYAGNADKFNQNPQKQQ
jgi:hypothetical protein